MTGIEERFCFYIVSSGDYLNINEAIAAANEHRVAVTHQHAGQTITVVPA